MRFLSSRASAPGNAPTARFRDTQTSRSQGILRLSMPGTKPTIWKGLDVETRPERCADRQARRPNPSVQYCVTSESREIA